MKELSIKEKAEAYDYAVNKAKELILNENGVVRVDKPLFDELFPSEMEESEGERIRKDLLGYLHTLPNHFSHNGSLVTEWVAWLEKQGEQILANSAKTCKDDQKPYGKREECLDCQMNYGSTCKGSCAMKRGEQKYWSEEDNFMYNKIKNLLTDISLAPESINSLSDWLKSLKDRYTWKPSDEQMTALRRMKAAIAGEGEIYKPLNSLYEDLKKLRKE